MTVPNLSDAELDAEFRRFERYEKPYISFALDQISLGKSKNGQYENLLEKIYKNMALVEYYKGNQQGFFDYLEQSVSLFNALLDVTVALPGNLSKLDQSNYSPITSSILIQNEQMTTEFCRKYRRIAIQDTKQDPKTAYSNFTLAYYTLLSGDMEQSGKFGGWAVKEAIRRDETIKRPEFDHLTYIPDEFRSDKQHLTTLLHMITINDQTGIASIWETVLEEYRIYYRNSIPEGALFLDGLALLKMNWLRNGAKFVPEVSDPRVPLELIYDV